MKRDGQRHLRRAQRPIRRWRVGGDRSRCARHCEFTDRSRYARQRLPRSRLCLLEHAGVDELTPRRHEQMASRQQPRQPPRGRVQARKKARTAYRYRSALIARTRCIRPGRRQGQVSIERGRGGQAEEGREQGREFNCPKHHAIIGEGTTATTEQLGTTHGGRRGPRPLGGAAAAAHGVHERRHVEQHARTLRRRRVVEEVRMQLDALEHGRWRELTGTERVTERGYEQLPLITLEQVARGEGAQPRPGGVRRVRAVQTGDQPRQLVERRQVGIHLVV